MPNNQKNGGHEKMKSSGIFWKKFGISFFLWRLFLKEPSFLRRISRSFPDNLPGNILGNSNKIVIFTSETTQM